MCAARNGANRLGISALSLETPYAFAGRKLLKKNDYMTAGEMLAESLVAFIRQLS